MTVEAGIYLDLHHYLYFGVSFIPSVCQPMTIFSPLYSEKIWLTIRKSLCFVDPSLEKHGGKKLLLKGSSHSIFPCYYPCKGAEHNYKVHLHAAISQSHSAAQAAIRELEEVLDRIWHHGFLFPQENIH